MSVVEGGIILSVGSDGPVCILSGQTSPNSATPALPNVGVCEAGTGSIYLQNVPASASTLLYVKSTFVFGAPGTWTAVTVP